MLTERADDGMMRVVLAAPTGSDRALRRASLSMTSGVGVNHFGVALRG
jgi:hypothetical protein